MTRALVTDIQCLTDVLVYVIVLNDGVKVMLFCISPRLFLTVQLFLWLYFSGTARKGE